MNCSRTQTFTILHYFHFKCLYMNFMNFTQNIKYHFIRSKYDIKSMKDMIY